MRNRCQQTDYQSAAGCQPAPQSFSNLLVAELNRRGTLWY
jgi:hypothetical protein